jgi:flagellar biosynthesis protein FlhB
LSDEAEKPFDATPSRRAKAKRDGNIVRAAEFAANAAFALAAVATVAVVSPMGAVAQRSIVRAAKGEVAPADVVALIGWALVPMAAAAVGGAAASVLQGGGLHVIGVGPKFERLSPAAGVKRLFSLEAVAHATRASLGVVVAAATAAPAIRNLFAAALVHASAASVAATAWIGAQHVVASIAILGGSLSFVEYAVARRDWLRKLRMTYAEFMRERKEQDGDPMARARRKSLHRSIARGAIQLVKDAACVVVNPTHIAVALDYRPPIVPVPVVLVRAADKMALRVRDVAREYGVPVVENVALARALFVDARPGAAIPTDHYLAVAEIVTALIRSGALG